MSKGVQLLHSVMIRGPQRYIYMGIREHATVKEVIKHNQRGRHNNQLLEKIEEEIAEFKRNTHEVDITLWRRTLKISLRRSSLPSVYRCKFVMRNRNAPGVEEYGSHIQH